MRKKIQTKSKPLTVSTTRQVGYDSDFYKWALSQAKILKNKEFGKLDIENLIEEIESLGKSDRRALKSHLINLLHHLLKIKFQPEYNCNSWKASISNSRQQIKFILEDSPSLKKEAGKYLESAYEEAKKKASLETEIPVKRFPNECPWSIKTLIK